MLPSYTFFLYEHERKELVSILERQVARLSEEEESKAYYRAIFLLSKFSGRAGVLPHPYHEIWDLEIPPDKEESPFT